MNNYLISINNIDRIEDYKKVGYTTFLFALKDYSVGYPSFSMEEVKLVKGNNFLLINRIIDATSMDNLKEILKDLTNIEGILFEDIGVFNYLKEIKYMGKKIYFHNHAGTNSKTINFWLNQGIDSVVVSNEITKEEIINLTNKCLKPLVINIFGHNQVMYSRRKVLSNYQDYYNKEHINNVLLKTNNTSFYALESEYGTVFYTKDIYNYTELIGLNALYYYVNLSLLSSIEEMIVLNALKVKEYNFKDIVTSHGFLDTKTIFKLGGK